MGIHSVRQQSISIGKCIAKNKKEPLKAPTMPTRIALAENATDQDKKDYEKVFDAVITEYAKMKVKHTERTEELEDEMRRVYVKVFNLMSDEVKFKVQRDSDYIAVSRDEDLIGLIDVIRKVCCGFHLQEGQEISYIMVQQIMKVINSFQRDKQPLDEFIRQTTSNLSAHNSCGGGTAPPTTDPYANGRRAVPEQTPRGGWTAQVDNHV
jgi:hypothetical protein